MKIYRQGDVLIRKTDRKVTRRHKRVPRERGRVVLAHGEVTGHAHAIAEQRVELFDLRGDRLLKVDQPANLVHEEHGTVQLPPGLYEVVRQREYDPADESLTVAD